MSVSADKAGALLAAGAIWADSPKEANTIVQAKA
jgi:hypothetical protein